MGMIEFFKEIDGEGRFWLTLWAAFFGAVVAVALALLDLLPAEQPREGGGQ
jgi:hypothetical protein